MRRIWHLSTCSTCKRILKDLDELPGFERTDIKDHPISGQELDDLAKIVGSYGALLNRRSNKYKEWGLKGKELTEADCRELILKEYTMLKRPVILNGEKLYVGNEKKTITAVKVDLGSKSKSKK